MTRPHSFDRVHETVLLTAREEVLLWEACANWVTDPENRTSEDIEATRLAAAQLVQQGLVWMYRIVYGTPDLSSAEVRDLISQVRPWESHPVNGTNDVVLRLTGEGKVAHLMDEEAPEE